MSLLDIFSSRKKRPRTSSGSTGDTNKSYMESLVTRLLPTSLSQRFSSLRPTSPGNGSAAPAELTDSSEDEPDPMPPSKHIRYNPPESQSTPSSQSGLTPSSYGVLYNNQPTTGINTYIKDVNITPTTYSISDESTVNRHVIYKSSNTSLSISTRKSIFESTKSNPFTEEKTSSNWLTETNQRFGSSPYGSTFYPGPTTFGGSPPLSSYINKPDKRRKSYMESLVTRLLPTSISKRFSSFNQSSARNGSANMGDFTDSSEDEPDLVPPIKRKRLNTPESQLNQCSQPEATTSHAETTDIPNNHSVLYSSIQTTPGRSTYIKDVKNIPSLYHAADDSNNDALGQEIADRDTPYKSKIIASSSGQSVATKRKSIFESAVKPKEETKQARSSEQTNSSWLNDKNPRFRPSLYGSPFYPGPTMYGGASAANTYINKPNVVLRKSVKVTEQQSAQAQTSATKKVLELLENFTSPLQEARRIPVIQKRNYLLNRHQPRPEPKPSVLSTYKYEFNTPSYATVLRVKQSLVNSSKVARQIEASVSSTASDQQPKIADTTSETSRPVEKESTSKHKVRLTRPNRGEDPLALPEPVQLPTAVLHIDKDNLPKFSITPSFFTSAPVQSTSHFKAQVSTSDNAAQPLAVASSSSTDVEVEEKDWKCDNCWIKNKSSVKKCAACGGSKPGAAEPIPAPLVVKNAEDNWKCEVCWINNKSSVKKCAACGGSKPGSTEVSEPAPPPPRSSSPVYKPKPDPKMAEFLRLQKAKWECSFCLIRNDPDKSRCQCCDMEREGPSKEITPKPFKFPKESNINLKFGFDPKEQEKNLAKKAEEAKPPPSNLEKIQTISSTAFVGFPSLNKKLDENSDNKKNEMKFDNKADSVVPEVPKTTFTFGVPKVLPEKPLLTTTVSATETVKEKSNVAQEANKFTFGTGFLNAQKSEQTAEPKPYTPFLPTVSAPANSEPQHKNTIPVASGQVNKSELNNEMKSANTGFRFADAEKPKGFSFGSFTGSQSVARPEFSFGTVAQSSATNAAPAPVPAFSSPQVSAAAEPTNTGSMCGGQPAVVSSPAEPAAAALFTMRSESVANPTPTPTFSFGTANNNKASPFGSTNNDNKASPFGQTSTNEIKVSPFGPTNNNDNKVSPFGPTNINDNKMMPFGSNNNNDNKASPFGSGFKPGGSSSAFPMSATGSLSDKIESGNAGSMPVLNPSVGSNSWGAKNDTSFGSSGGVPTRESAPFTFSAMSTESGPTALFGAQPAAGAQMPFGGGLFGNTSQPSQPANIFGAQSTSNVFGAQSQPSVFGVGSQAPAFGTPAPTQLSAFGTPAPSQPSAFGVSAPTPTFGTPASSQPPAFAAPTINQPSAFGASTQSQLPAFGTPTPGQTPAFAAPAQNQLPAFGSPSSSQPSAFGTPAQSQPPAFGASVPNQPPAFGVPTPSQPIAFGAPAQSQPSGFGATAQNLPPTFGGPTPAQPPAFGGLVQSQHSAFGAPPQNQPPAFGTSTPNQPAFGSGGQAQLGDFNFGGSRVFKFGDQQAQPSSVYNFAGSAPIGGMNPNMGGGMMAQPMDGGMGAGGAQFSLGSGAVTSGRRVRKAVRRTQR